MSLSLSLNNALSGLNINRQSLAVLSQNIANANTKGYSRQIITQESIYIDGQGSGVDIQSVTRKVDDYLTRSIQLQNSSLSKNSTISDYSDRIQILLGKPGNQDSIDSSIGSFFNSLQSLASTPEDSSLRVNAVNNAKNLAGKISDLSAGLNDLRFQADQDVLSAATAINTDLVEINKLNKTISTESALGKSVADLQDKRDILVKDLSQYLDIQTYNKSSGEMSITTNSGVGLLDESVYQLSYKPAGSADSFANNSTLSALEVFRLDDKGNPVGAAKNLVSGGTPDSIISSVSNGKIAGLVDLRDKQIPAIINQLDNMAQVLRDSVNAIHNSGSGYPGATSLTGTHLLNASDYSLWNGQISIAVLNSSGQPASSPYPDETITRPLNLDLSSMDSGNGTGQPSVQAIVDEINRNFGTPQSKVEIGNLNNISLVSNTKTLPASPPQFNFDFNMENISATNAGVFVTGVQVFDSNGVALATPTSTLPSVTLAGTYTTSAGSSTITVNTTGTNTLKNGDKIYLSQPNSAIDGIAANNFDNYFTVSNVTSTGFDVTVNGVATAGGSQTVAGQIATTKYSDVAAGDSVRGKANGTVTADLSGNPTSSYYTIKVNVGVDDGAGNISTSLVTYRVDNNSYNLTNNRYAASTATGDGKIVYPTSNQPIAKAMLVDANGNELAKYQGIYTSTQQGYLKIVSGNSNNYLAIDTKDSAEQGKPYDNPPTASTGRNFSHFFGLNNFFVDNSDPRTVKTVGSAVALKVEQRLSDNPNLISLGKLSPVTNSDGTTNYGYERNIGDNSIIQALATLGTQAVSFGASGGLGQTSQSFGGYAGQIIGAASTNANAASTLKTNAQTLLDGYSQRSDSISGVNLDEELANTIVYQNAYSASARIITVVSALFDTLLQIGR
jgi:flagellar hook-associated protein FlgK